MTYRDEGRFRRRHALDADHPKHRVRLLYGPPHPTQTVIIANPYLKKWKERRA